MPQVILVTPNDHQHGTMEKQSAHDFGFLHRAISVLVFNQDGEFLIQRRAATKYHTPGLWANTCCTHPHPGESTRDAAHRCLQTEVGLKADPKLAFTFIYRAELDQGTIEHEFDHVFAARHEGPAVPNSAEVQAVRWISQPDLIAELDKNPELFAIWFRLILERWLSGGFSI